MKETKLTSMQRKKERKRIKMKDKYPHWGCTKFRCKGC